MLYNKLASSLDDLAPVEVLIDELEDPINPVTSILPDHYLSGMFEQIRVETLRNMPIFSSETHVYTNFLIIRANNMLIHLHEVSRNINNSVYVQSNDLCRRTNFMMLAIRIRELVRFFEGLDKTRQ